MISKQFHFCMIYRSVACVSFDADKIYFQTFLQALRYLGFNPTEEQQRELRHRLPADQGGFVSYGGKYSKR